MIIKDVRAFPVDLRRGSKSPAAYQRSGRQPAAPTERYARYRGARDKTFPEWKQCACLVTVDDGTVGFGLGGFFADPVSLIINDHFREHLIGESVMATEKLYDVMIRISAAYGGSGLTAHAISAVDLALWDAKGKIMGAPVYELLGGPQKERIPCYATGFDLEWYQELGFLGFKLPNPFGPEDGTAGIRQTEEMVASARDILGPDAELMLDCWMALDTEYTVRLGEALRPYRLRWIEDYLMPDDMAGFANVRKRLPTQGLATGEHWHLTRPFKDAAEQQVVDYFQPDLQWVGGISACVRICHIAEASGIAVAPHGGMDTPYGQHLAMAMPAVTWGERADGVSPPGVPLADMVSLPGTPIIKDGYLIPNTEPGFGIHIDVDWLEKITISRS